MLIFRDAVIISAGILLAVLLIGIVVLVVYTLTDWGGYR